MSLVAPNVLLFSINYKVTIKTAMERTELESEHFTVLSMLILTALHHDHVRH